jgi:PAT family beta-lactamase induction signal transducer AmpG
LTLSEHRILRLFTLCALYVAQGIPWGFVTFTLAAYLADQGLSTGEVGAAMALSTAPWTFKWLWGPVIDRFRIPSMGVRRPWILLAQFLMALTILAMLAMPNPETQLGLLGALVFVHNCFNSLQDVAVDALAVDLLPESERGLANGLMYGSKYLGGGLGGAGLATVMKHSGLQGAITVQGLLLLLIFMLPLLVRERPGDRFFFWSRPPADESPHPVETVGTRELFRTLFRVFRLRSPLLGALFAVGAQLAAGALGVIATVFYVQRLGWADAEYAQIAGGPALIFGLGGSILGGWLADRLGRRRVIAASATALGLAWIAFSLLESQWGIKGFVTAFLLVEPLFMSMMSGAMFALFMDLSLPKVAATQFTAYMAMLNLSTTLGHSIAGKVKDALDYPEIFLLAGVVQIVAMVLLLGIDPQQTRRELAAVDEGGDHGPGGTGSPLPTTSSG